MHTEHYQCSLLRNKSVFLGINILGRFLLSRDNNIRYVALATLQRVVSVDVKVALQQHQMAPARTDDIEAS